MRRPATTARREPSASSKSAETPDYLDAWLGDHLLPIRHTSTPGGGIRGVGIATDRGEIVLE